MNQRVLFCFYQMGLRHRNDGQVFRNFLLTTENYKNLKIEIVYRREFVE